MHTRDAYTCIYIERSCICIYIYIGKKHNTYTPSMPTLTLCQWTAHTIQHPRPAAAAADHGGGSHTPSVGHMGPQYALAGQYQYQGRAGGLSNSVSPLLLQQCSLQTRLELTRAHKLHTTLRCMLWVCEVFGACTVRAGIPCAYTCVCVALDGVLPCLRLAVFAGEGMFDSCGRLGGRAVRTSKYYPESQ